MFFGRGCGDGEDGGFGGAVGAAEGDGDAGADEEVALEVGGDGVGVGGVEGLVGGDGGVGLHGSGLYGAVGCMAMAPVGGWE